MTAFFSLLSRKTPLSCAVFQRQRVYIEYKMPAILALRVMLGLIHLFQLYASPIDKTILANGIVWVTTIALRCLPCVTQLRLLPEICEIPLWWCKLFNDLFLVSRRGLRLSNKARFLRQELTNFHRFKCQVLLRSYSFDSPLQNGEISVWKRHTWVQNMLTIWRDNLIRL